MAEFIFLSHLVSKGFIAIVIACFIMYFEEFRLYVFCAKEYLNAIGRCLHFIHSVTSARCAAIYYCVK